MADQNLGDYERLAMGVTALASTLQSFSDQFEDIALNDALLGIDDSSAYKGGVAYGYAQAATLTRELLNREEQQ